MREGNLIRREHHLACAFFAFGLAGPAIAQETAATATPAAELDEIVVTASRRESTIRDTPIAVSAYSGAALESARVDSLKDLTSRTPNLQFGGIANNANVSIRGIGNTQLTLGSDPGVAFHEDNVYLGQTALAGSNFLDVARVEVLRGPQGTLFGRNATGGVVNLVSNLPTAGFEAGANASLEADPAAARVTGFVSGPLDDTGALRGRVAVLRHYNKGFTKNLNPAGPERLDNLDTIAARAQLQWLPSDNVNLRLLLEHQSAGDNGPAIYNVGVTALSGVEPIFIAGEDFGSVDKRKVYQNFGYRNVKATTATTTGDFGLGGGNLRALYSYNETKQNFAYEVDGTIVDFSHTIIDQKSHQHFAELLYTSDAAQPFSFVLGTNYFRESTTQSPSVFVSFLSAPVIIVGDLTTSSYAAFGQAQYHVGAAKAFAGLRYTRDRKSLEESNNFVGSAAQESSWSRLTYEFGASYDLARSVTGYARYSTGFKSGGFSAGSLAAPFDPERNSSIEVGLKGRYLNGALTANIAAFHMKYDDLQVQQIIGVVSAITNAAKATINGVEVEMEFQPTAQVHITASGAWLDATFDDFLTEDSARPSLGALQLAGNHLPLAPEFSASIGVSYEFHVGDGVLTPTVQYDWKSHVYFTEFNIAPADQKAVGVVDLSLMYRTGDGRFTAGVFARNLTDEQIRSNILVTSAILGSEALASYRPGRQIGVSVGYRY